VTARDIDPKAVAIAVGDPLADQVLDGDARLEPVTVPGVDRTVVWRVIGESGDHPWQVYVGAMPDGQVRVLSADQGAWDEVMAAADATLGSEADALAYVEAYLEATRAAMVIVRPVRSIDDLRWRPGSDREEAAKAAFTADPPELAPVVERSDGGFHVELTLVVDQRVQRNEFDVSPSGAISGTSFRVLAEDLPLPVAR
jgi:hypothetical protein